MKTAKQLTAVVQTPCQSTGDQPALEKEIVARFFERIKKLYGSKRFEQAWPTKDDLRVEMQIWGADIVRYSDQELRNKLHFAKTQMHLKDWRFPNIALILNSEESNSEAGANTHLARRDVNTVMANVLPAPGKVDREANRAKLRALRDSL